MTEKIKKKLDSWSSLIRFITPVGVFLLLLLQAKFATRDEIKQIQAEIVKINTSITLLLDWNRRNDDQDEKISALQERQQKTEIALATLRE